MSVKVRLNHENLEAQIAHLRRFGVPSDQEDPVPISLPENEAKMLNFITVAINHQTTPVRGPALAGVVFGQERRGWDYLRERFLVAVQYNPEIVSPETLSRFTPKLLSEVLGKRPIKKPRERTRLLRDIGHKMLIRGWQNIQEAYDHADGYLVRSDHGGILEQLSEFAAYADPLQKKSNYFLAMMQNQGYWTYRDPENLGPPVNYHEARLQVRLGGVEVLDKRFLRKLLGGQKITPEEDFLLRQAVKEALCYVARGLGVSPTRLHYANWNIARNCCTRKDPHCNACTSACTLPERYKLGDFGGQRCILAEVCVSKNSAQKPIDPYSETIWH